MMNCKIMWMNRFIYLYTIIIFHYQSTLYTRRKMVIIGMFRIHFSDLNQKETRYFSASLAGSIFDCRFYMMSRHPDRSFGLVSMQKLAFAGDHRIRSSGIVRTLHSKVFEKLSRRRSSAHAFALGFADHLTSGSESPTPRNLALHARRFDTYYAIRHHNTMSDADPRSWRTNTPRFSQCPK